MSELPSRRVRIAVASGSFPAAHTHYRRYSLRESGRLPSKSDNAGREYNVI
jgi:hypothetical protein